MQIILDARKSINENAAAYFEKAKKSREKRAAIEKAIAEVEEKIRKTEKEIEAGEGRAQNKLIEQPVRRKEWFERFHYFFTSGRRLAVAGKDAAQNELLVKHYFDERDLFFHADVHGAAATILKDGVNAGAEERREAAQWAACFSSAWKGGFASVDVYAVRREQVSKTPRAGEYLPKGAFVIRGQRDWFKNTELKLACGFNSENELVVVPKMIGGQLKKAVEVLAGEKKEIVGELAGKLSLGKSGRERLSQLLP